MGYFAKIIFQFLVIAWGLKSNTIIQFINEKKWKQCCAIVNTNNDSPKDIHQLLQLSHSSQQQQQHLFQKKICYF